MKYVKMLSLAVAMSAALMACAGAGSASATVLCKTPGEFAGKATGTTCPTGSAFQAESGFHSMVSSREEPLILKVTFKKPFEQELNLECPEGTMKGKTSNEGGEGQAVSIPMEIFTFLECPLCEFYMLKAGTFTINWNSGTHNASITSNGTEMTTRCFFWTLGTLHCIYKTENTSFGTILGGNPGTLEVKATVPMLPTDFYCPELTWEGTYTMTEATEPSALYVAEKT